MPVELVGAAEGGAVASAVGALGAVAVVGLGAACGGGVGADAGGAAALPQAASSAADALEIASWSAARLLSISDRLFRYVRFARDGVPVRCNFAIADTDRDRKSTRLNSSHIPLSRM